MVVFRIFLSLPLSFLQAGIEEFASFFPDWHVTPVRVMRGVLHLKSMASICGVNKLAISSSPAGQLAWKDIETKAKFKYERFLFPDNNGANCLFMNGTIMHPSRNEYPRSWELWQQFNCPRIELENSELAKADGSLTCNSIRCSNP